ncbi:MULTISPECIES: hypothetical protein [Streptomyces]|uniref:DUF4375 domain-containing protein n=1 Tax=Streptomyces albidoflavus TaxID=1886 RepID=A0AB37XEF3_9ACTN|nr:MULTISPECIES: hypothetical protein [Streptomyces]RZE40829.1 hypothetical protein C0Q91_13610 [Streptomyces albidoflavus]
MIVNRYFGSKQPDEYDELEQHLTQGLNAPLDWPEDGGLTVSHVAKIASAATCDSAYSRAANGHLIDLFAALPLPGTPEGSTFWRRILDAADEAAWNIVPANMGGPFFDRIQEGNEGGIASRVLSFLEELTPSQRADVAEVIGSTLDKSTVGVSGRYGGELWLRDAEMSAWRVALASRREFETAQDRERFFEAWRNA